MRNPGGYLIITDPSRATIEMDTFTCAHCNAVVPVKPMRVGGRAATDFDVCANCKSKPICSNCSGKGCTPFERKLEQAEARDRLKRNIDVAMMR